MAIRRQLFTKTAYKHSIFQGIRNSLIIGLPMQFYLIDQLPLEIRNIAKNLKKEVYMKTSKRNFLLGIGAVGLCFSVFSPIEARVRLLRPLPRPSPRGPVSYPTVKVPVKAPYVPRLRRNYTSAASNNAGTPISQSQKITNAREKKIATSISALTSKTPSGDLRKAMKIERSDFLKAGQAAGFKIKRSDVHAHHIFEFKNTRNHPAIVSASRSGLWNHNGKANGVALHKDHHAKIHTKENQQKVNQFLDELHKKNWSDAQKAIVLRNAARDIRRAITKNDTLAQHLNYAKRSFNVASAQ